MNVEDPGEVATSRGVTNNLARGVDVTKPTQWPCLGCGAPLSGRGGKKYCGTDCRPRCSVADCEKPVHTKEMCSAHATRAERYGDPVAPKVRLPNDGPCAVEGCDQPMRKTRLCASHYAMQYAEGEIREWRHRWGDGGYGPAHRTLRDRLGKATEHVCVDCGKQAQEWSYNGGDPNEITDSSGRVFARNPEAYSPRCVRCHRLFDDNPIAVKRE